MNKSEITFKAKSENIIAFKSSDENNMSLTENGFIFVKKLNNNTFYHITFKDIKTYDVMKLSKVFKTPYYINIEKKTLYHFDELINVQSLFYKDNLGSLLDSFL